jgi:hypothetical protein
VLTVYDALFSEKRTDEEEKKEETVKAESPDELETTEEEKNKEEEEKKEAVIEESSEEKKKAAIDWTRLKVMMNDSKAPDGADSFVTKLSCFESSAMSQTKLQAVELAMNGKPCFDDGFKFSQTALEPLCMWVKCITQQSRASVTLMELAENKAKLLVGIDKSTAAIDDCRAAMVEWNSKPTRAQVKKEEKIHSFHM